MPIPSFNADGFLPQGLYDSSIEEVRERFGRFQHSDQRPKLFAKLEAFLAAAKGSALIRQVLVDGSFVTDEPTPNDIDLIIVILADSDLTRDLLPAQYNVLSKKRVRAQFGFDVVAVRENTIELDEAIAFFEQVRERPDLRKGIVKLSI